MEKYGITFKEMNRKQKVKHIWTYYRYHILAAVIAVVVVSLLGKTLFFPEAENDVDVMICGPLYLGKDAYDVTNSFKDKYHTGLNLTALNWEGDPETSEVMLQKIPLMISVKSLEILALPEEQYEGFVKVYGTDMFTPLEDIPELKEVLEAQSENLFTCDKAVDEEGNEIEAEEHIYGIKVSSFANIPCIEQNSEMIIGLTSTLRDKSKAIEMYQYILGDSTAIEDFSEVQN